MANFSLDMSKFKDKSQKAIDGAIRKTVLDLTTSIILDTPIDKGTARGAWSVSFETPDNTKIENTNWTANLSDQTNKLASNKIGKYIYIQNNLPYIVKLEYGYSKQSPNGMVRRNIARFSKI